MSNDLDLQPRSSFTYVYVLNFTMNKTKILFASADKTLKFSGRTILFNFQRMSILNVLNVLLLCNMYK